MSRADHLFQFAATTISEAAKSEASYHRQRLTFWTAERDAAADTVRSTMGARLEWHEHTGGGSWGVVVNYGDPAASHRLAEAQAKLESHLKAADRYDSDALLYGTQGDRIYELDSDDVAHFRLGGQPREE